MLTADQIHEFERRAAAGEMPVHPGWDEGVDAADFNVYKLHGYKAVEYLGGAYDLYFNRKFLGRFRYHLHESNESPAAAAQLAAEALLMEATAPLWAETVKALKKAAGALRSIQTVKSVEPNPLLSLEQIFDIMETVNLAAIESAAKKASKEA